MMGLTAKQREMYDFIAATIAERGFAPTFDEMAGELGLRSKSQVSWLLDELVARGAVRRLRNRARAIQIVAPSVTLNTEILTLTDRYAAEHKISRDTAANELLRIALGAAA